MEREIFTPDVDIAGEPAKIYAAEFGQQEHNSSRCRNYYSGDYQKSCDIVCLQGLSAYLVIFETKLRHLLFFVLVASVEDYGVYE